MIYLDEIDRKIISQLQADGRATLNDMSRQIGFTSMGTKKRLERLIKKGIIKREGHQTFRWQSSIDPNIRMATALFNDERNYRKQMLQKNTPVVDKVTPIVDKIIEKADNIVEKKEPVPSVKFSIQINITDKGIEMSKKDFINLVSKV